MTLSDQSVDRRAFHFDICLGKGGFGEVYLAKMTSAGGLRSQVAVKVLLESVDPRSQPVQRLRDEARQRATLRHPSIPQVHDLVLLNGRVGLVVEYIEGADLETCITGDHPISPRALIESVGQIADALDEAFTSNGPDGEPLHLVHRDVKPANIRLGRRGSVKLLDFGIARAQLSNREAKTQKNAVIGSFPYMAPERFSETGALDPRGDVFSLGCVIYEGITGQRLFGDLEAMQIWALVADDDAHAKWVQERLNALHQLDPRVLQLLRDTLTYAADDRLTAPQLVARCEDLAPSLPGATLRSWARSHTWPEPADHGGPLAGQTVMESAFSLARTADSIVPEKGALPGPPPSDAGPAKPRSSWTTFQETSATGESAPTAEAPAGLAHTTFAPPPPPPPGVQSARPRDETTFTERQAPSPAAAPASDAKGAPPPAPKSLDPDPLPTAEVRPPRKGMMLGAGAALLGVAMLALVGIVVVVMMVSGGGTDGAEAKGSPGDGVADIGAVDPAIDEGQVGDELNEDGEPPSDLIADPEGTEDVPPGTVDEPTGTAEPGAPGTPSEQAVADEAVDAPPPATAAGEQVSVEGCGEVQALEMASASSRLTTAQLSCLKQVVRNDQAKQTEQDKAGRIVLVQLKEQCKATGNCRPYETEQRYFFDEVTQSDPNMTLGFAAHLYSKVKTPEAYAEAIRWSDRAIERRTVWKGRTLIRNYSRALELRTRAAYKVWEHWAARDPAKAEAWKDKTVTYSVEWSDYLGQLGSDQSPAFRLCASAAGSEGPCKSRLVDDSRKISMLLSSIPLGATVQIDGKEAGKTPLTIEMSIGEHSIEMSAGAEGSAKRILVGDTQPTKHIWQSSEDTWSASF